VSLKISDPAVSRDFLLWGLWRPGLTWSNFRK